MYKKMILLISSKYDVTTTIVARWLHGLDAEFIRINTETQSILNYLIINKKAVDLCINTIDFTKVKKVWHRRGRLRHLPLSLNNLGNVTQYLKKEEDSLIKSIENLLKQNIDYVGSYIQEAENYKLDHLILARACGLNIPDSIVTTSKKELLKFNSSYRKIITKELRYPISVNAKNMHISSVGTFVVETGMIESLDDTFAPVFLQEYIEKQWEIRIFFYKEKLYPMAIFSQNDTFTKTDYRNYNRNTPNRCVPVNLPPDIIEKIKAFTSKAALTTGSIDIIYSEKGEYVFLEVNPMGQLDWLSKNCNYYIEKEIAEDLISDGID